MHPSQHPFVWAPLTVMIVSFISRSLVVCFIMCSLFFSLFTVSSPFFFSLRCLFSRTRYILLSHCDYLDFPDFPVQDPIAPTSSCYFFLQAGLILLPLVFLLIFSASAILGAMSSLHPAGLSYSSFPSLAKRSWRTAKGGGIRLLWRILTSPQGKLGWGLGDLQGPHFLRSS